MEGVEGATGRLTEAQLRGLLLHNVFGEASEDPAATRGR